MRWTFAAMVLCASLASTSTAVTTAPVREHVHVSPDKKGFALAESGRPFIPWGYNYDRNHEGGLLESYWHEKWPKVVADFRQMKAMGGNVVRIHLQFASFMDSPDKPNERNFAQLERLVSLAEETGLYLDLTGLACYRKQDVPAWYDALDESHRWDAQARFWEEVARRCNGRAGVMFYDLMNEPIVPGDKQPDKQWLFPMPFGGFYFVQFITLDPAGRKREDIAAAWIQHLTAAIRRQDKEHLISVGLLPNSVPGPGFTSGFTAAGVAPLLDFLCVHEYPQHGKVDKSVELLKQFQAGKPLVIEETFPLNASQDETADFITRSRGTAAGVISFFWGQPTAELKASTQPGDWLVAAWLERFEKLNPNR